MNLKGVLEGILFVVGDEGITVSSLLEILNVDKETLKNFIIELKNDYEKSDRGIRLSILGDAFKLTTKKEHKDYYEKLLENDENNTLSNSAIETLAIIAYNEPITRIEVDEIRGIQSGPMIRKLVAKGFIKEVGKSDAPGRPILYKTTSEFLDYFNMSSLKELPKIDAVKEIIDDIDLYDSRYKEETEII
ncbi:MAG: SMC-Scp complex subunit ScpB [Bacilli bacterium]|nr:SMC-Scp complex subunit ScpB [Bacilli bacterium]